MRTLFEKLIFDKKFQKYFRKQFLDSSITNYFNWTDLEHDFNFKLEFLKIDDDIQINITEFSCFYLNNQIDINFKLNLVYMNVPIIFNDKHSFAKLVIGDNTHYVYKLVIDCQNHINKELHNVNLDLDSILNNYLLKN